VSLQVLMTTSRGAQPLEQSREYWGRADEDHHVGGTLQALRLARTEADGRYHQEVVEVGLWSLLPSPPR
jgi:hypothetical protein